MSSPISVIVKFLSNLNELHYNNHPMGRLDNFLFMDFWGMDQQNNSQATNQVWDAGISQTESVTACWG